MKILIIEDEPDLLSSLKASLEKEKYIVETANDYLPAIRKISDYDYSCILIDISLPGGNGLEILKNIKELGKADCTIVISAKNALNDKIYGLELGADDYIAKPFHLLELNARIKAVLRRKNFSGQNVLTLNNLTVNFSDRTVAVDDQKVQLNRKEYDLLVLFVENKNRLIRKTALAEHVWGDHIDESDNLEFIYSQIKNLRKKLKDHHAAVEIQAVYGVGYKLLVE